MMQSPYAEMGYNEDEQTARECGDELTMKHMLVCPILPQPCSHEDLHSLTPGLIYFDLTNPCRPTLSREQLQFCEHMY